MPDTLQRVRPRPPLPPLRRGPGRNGFGDNGEGPWKNPSPAPRSVPVGQFGMWLLLGSLTILFAAFSSAYIVRVGPLSERLTLPAILWWNTALLVAGSGLLVGAVRAVRRSAWSKGRRLLGMALLCGALFLVGQLEAWRSLAAQGVFLQTHPASSFFYVLTAVHGLHLLGGLIALGWALGQSARPQAPVSSRLRRVVENAALYWHFLGLIWLWVFALLGLL